MKSSSALFPVSLLRAETHGDINEDVYLLKHNRCQDKSVEIALSRFSLSTACAHSLLPAHHPQNARNIRQPLVFAHGSFTNRNFWMSEKGVGLARFLLDQGFDIWLYEQRGHGFSPRNFNYRKNTLEQYVLTDVAAINEFVIEQTTHKPFWLGHSLGGVIIASALASGVLNSENCQGSVQIGTQALRRPWYLWPPFSGLILRGLMRLKGELDGRKLGIGPENEPAGLINEHMARLGWFGSWQFKSTKQKLLPAWQQLGLPLMAIAAAKDTSDPAKYCQRFYQQYGSQLAANDNADNASAENNTPLDKSWLLLGKEQGHKRVYGHIDMIVSKEAAKEVWPQIANWLQQRCQDHSELFSSENIALADALPES